MTQDWTYVVDVPGESWVELPEPGESVAGWAEEVCAAVRVDGVAARELAEQLRAVAVAARDQDVQYGAVWLPRPELGVLAVLATDLVANGEGEPPLDLDGVERLELSAGSLGGPPEVGRVRLPAGEAVRSRRVERGGTSVFGTDRVGEVVTHTLVPGDLLDARCRVAGILHRVSWSMLEEGDDLAELADDCVRLLRIERG